MSAKILIVEDELIIAEDIREKILSYGYEAVDVVDNYEDAMAAIINENPDLILLDITLKGGKSGIEIAKEVDASHQIPYIFLTSNHDSKTLEAVKSVHPSSYLMKPFQKEELYIAIELAFQNPLPNKTNEDVDHIFIKEGHIYQKIFIRDIRYLKSEGVYIEIFTDNKRYLIRDSFKNILQKLPQHQFLQVHKSYCLNKERISSVGSISIWILEDEIPLGRTYKDDIFNILGLPD